MKLAIALLLLTIAGALKEVSPREIKESTQHLKVHPIFNRTKAQAGTESNFPTSYPITYHGGNLMNTPGLITAKHTPKNYTFCEEKKEI
jgi:hypothetical protein